MQLIRESSHWPAAVRGGVATIGNFDGVHRGHALLVERLLARARSQHQPAVVFTFDPHPAALLRPDRVPPPLTTTERKAELLAALGVDALIVYPTSHQLLGLSPADFFEQLIRQQLDARGLIEGPNFCFGKARAGDVQLLAQFCQEAGIYLEIPGALQWGEQVVSSSRVRELLAAGEMDAANQLLTEPYRLQGIVEHGAARGTAIGFPTANLGQIETLIPAAGVYAAAAHVADETWPAAVHIGPAPTFDIQPATVEVHLIGFHGNLYGQSLSIDVLARLRSVQRFAGVSELRQQLQLDVARAAEVYSQKGSLERD